MLAEMVGGPMCGVIMEVNHSDDEIRFPILHRNDVNGVYNLEEGTELPVGTEYLEYVRGNEGLSKVGGIKYFFKRYGWPDKQEPPYYGGLGGY